tara:strand:+ start:984 stop:1199 length:216 start_codon:yes stop_codon:yes gene_type:complete
MTLEKDYYTVNEAAVYMGLSLSGFKVVANANNIPFGKVPRGNKIYRRSDLSKLNEQYFNADKIFIEGEDRT